MDKQELEEILNSYKWIRVKQFKPNSENLMEKYLQLEEHHLKETEFLINKCRELAKELLKKQ